MNSDNHMECEKISVVIATYNNAEYIAPCIESVLNAKVDEIVIVDDNSNDETFNVVQSFEQKNIRYHKFSVNSGPSAARNFGIEIAKNNLVSIIDGDDFIPEDRFVNMRRKLIEENADVVVDQLVAFCDKTKGVLWKKPRLAAKLDGINTFDLIYKDYGSLKPLIRKDAIFGKYKYPENVNRGEDFIFLLSLLMDNRKVSFCSDAHYYIRRNHGGNLTAARTKLFADLLRNETHIYKYNKWSAAEHLAWTYRLSRNFIGYIKSRLRGY